MTETILTNVCSSDLKETARAAVDERASYKNFCYRDFWFITPKWYVNELETALEDATDRIYTLEISGNAHFVSEAHNISQNYLKVFELYGTEKAARIKADAERDYYKEKYNKYKLRESKRADVNADIETPGTAANETTDGKIKSKSGLSYNHNCEVAYCMYCTGVDVAHIADVLRVSVSTVKKYISRAERAAVEKSLNINGKDASYLAFKWE